MSFSDLGLSDELLKAISDAGYTDPTPIQAQAIPQVLMGRDILGCAQTGTGKTASFTLPMIEILASGRAKARMPRSLILEPTRELAAQVADNFEIYGKYHKLNHALLIGGENMSEQIKRLEKGVDVLIATPGRLMDVFDRGHLLLRDVKILVIDEADRMLDMGFSEDVITIANACPAERQTLLFSATKGSAGLQRIAESVLREPQWLELDSIRDGTPAIHQQVIPTDDSNHKEATLKWLLTHESPGKALVFTNTRDMADRLNGVLRAADLRVFVLHGEKDQKIRKLAIERFKQSQRAVLVATDVAARGLDIDALDLVINFDMPRSGDDYLHRVGRTGRAGAEGIAISLVAPHEWNLMSSIERYLRRQFERRILKEVPGSFKGPKKVKASGKPVGSKKPKESKKVKEGKKKKAESKRPESGKAGTPRPASTARPKTSADGMSTFKRPG